MAISPKQQRILHLLGRPEPPPVKGKRGKPIPQRNHLYRGWDGQFFVTYSAGEVYEPLTRHETEELRASGGCGCDDLNACVHAIQLDDLIEPNFKGGVLVETPRKVAAMDACHWLRIDRTAGLGVCSACPVELIERWDAGERGGRA